jgi:hypothetical protein
VETFELFPVYDLYVAPAAVEPEAEEAVEPVTVIPGQLDLFTGEVAA